jgi:hypothetical protein
MPLTTDLRYFKLSEFKHPELVDARAGFWLDELREEYGKSMILTDDARPAGVIPPGGSAKSLHFKGRAFDLRIRHFTWGDLWDFVGAVYRLNARMPPSERGVELEIVWSTKDKHGHIGFPMDGRRNRLIVAAD